MRRRRIESIIVTDEDRRCRMREMTLRIQWFLFGMTAACLAVAQSLPGFLTPAGLTFGSGLIVGYIRYRFNRFVEHTSIRPADSVVDLPAAIMRKQQRG